ncbi:MAG: hypothetical protein ACRDGG_04665 [Anaerolineae bacterium]
MDERDQLERALDKLTNDQVRILARFAEIIAEEQKADPMHDTGDAGVRFEQFKQWCAVNDLDLAGVEAWIQESRRASASAAAAASQ